jgi:ribosome biogenesis GTPase
MPPRFLYGNERIEQLKEMIGKVSMFSGHFGVGKSTLVNAGTFAAPKTKVISEASKQGSTLRPLLKCMTYLCAKIIDTPGIKGLG